MLNMIVIVVTAMGLVAFGGLGYTWMQYLRWENGMFDLLVLFATGVGVGACWIALWNALVSEYLEIKGEKEYDFS